MLYIICADAAVLFYNCRRRELANKEKSEKNKQTAGDLILNENHELESIDEKLFCFFFILFNPVYLRDVIWKRSLTSQDERGDVLTTRSPYIFPFISFSHVQYMFLVFFPRGILFFFFFCFCFISLLGSFIFLFPLSVNCHNTTNTSRYIRN